jgi:hypothetical protein
MISLKGLNRIKYLFLGFKKAMSIYNTIFSVQVQAILPAICFNIIGYINFNLVAEPYLMDNSSDEMEIDDVAIQCGHVVNFVNINSPKEEIEVLTTKIKDITLKRNIKNTVLVR